MGFGDQRYRLPNYTAGIQVLARRDVKAADSLTRPGADNAGTLHAEVLRLGVHCGDRGVRAADRPTGLGGVVLQNLVAGEFPGTLYGVNPHAGDTVLGVPCTPDIASLPEAPELAVVCTSPHRIPGIVSELGEKGVKAVSIVMGGLSQATPGDASPSGQAPELAQSLLDLSLGGGKTLKEATWEAAQPYDMRILGPNSIGAIVPPVTWIQPLIFHFLYILSVRDEAQLPLAATL